MANDFKRGIRVYLETSDYGKGIGEMVNATKKYEAEIQRLTEESRRMTAAGQNTGKAYQDVQKQLKANQDQLRRSQAAEADYRKRMQETEKVLKNLSGSTYNELIKVKQKIRTELQRTSRGTEEYSRKMKMYEAVTREAAKAQREMNVEVGCQGTAMGKASGFVNKYIGLITGFIASATGAYMAVRKFTDLLDAREESQANLQALTGLDPESIKWLTQQSAELSAQMTADGVRIRQSSREILDAMTVVGSQRPELLKNKEALLQVTRDALTMSIASKDSLEASTQALTNTLNQFNLEGSQSNRIINAMAAGSKAGAATIPYLSQAIEKSGTTFALMGVEVETAIGVIEAVAPKFKEASVAGNSLDKVLLKMKSEAIGYKSGVFDMNDAIAELKQRFDNGESAAKIFGVEHAKMAEILVQSAGEVQRYTDAVTGTNTALEQAAINSDTRAARLAQAKNAFNEAAMALVEKFTPAMTEATEAGVQFITFLRENPAIIKALVVAIGIYTLAIIANTAAKAKDIIIDKAKLVLDKAMRISSLSLAAAKAVLTGNITRARIAMSLLNKTMLVNPYVAIAAVITALGVAIYKLATRTTEADKAMSGFLAESARETTELNNIFEAYKKANEGTDEKKRLLELIKQKYGGYIQNLIDEKGNIIDIEKAQKQANTALRESIALKSQDAAINKATTEEIEYQAETLGDLRKRIASKKGNELANIITDEITNAFRNNANDLKKATNDAFKIIDKYNLREGVVDRRKFSMDINQLFSSMFRLDKKTKEIKANFKGLIGNMATITGDSGTGGSGSGSGSGSGGGGGSTGKTTLDKKIASLDRDKLLEQNSLKKKYSENQLDKESYDAAMLQLDADFLIKKRELYKKDSDEYLKITNQLLDMVIDKRIKGIDAELRIIEDGRKALDEATNQYDASERERLQNELANNLINQEQYNNAIVALDVTVAERRLQTAQDYQELISNATFNSEADKKKAVDAAVVATTAASAELVKAQKKVTEQKLKEEKEYHERVQRIRQELGLDKEKLSYQQGLDALKAKLRQAEATEKESADAILAYKVSKYKQYAETAQEIVQGITTAVTAYHEMEANSLEASKQKELQAAGNNADERERIEKEYAQKELDLKKKQSGADAAIKIASALAAGAMGIANVWGVHGANPVLAGILSALVATTTGIQIASILKQREAIMATTLNSSTSGSSATGATGARVPVEQAASGRWDVIGADDGRTYRNVPYRGIATTGLVTRPTLVGERGDEVIIDNPTLRNIRMNAPDILSRISRLRVPQRAQGNYPQDMPSTGSTSTTELKIIAEAVVVLRKLERLLQLLSDQGVDAYILLDEFERKQRIREKSVKKGSLK